MGRIAGYADLQGWVLLVQAARAVEGFGSYGIWFGDRRCRCSNMSALDILTASGQVIICVQKARCPHIVSPEKTPIS